MKRGLRRRSDHLPRIVDTARSRVAEILSHTPLRVVPPPVEREMTAAVEYLDGRELYGWVDCPQGSGPLSVSLMLDELEVGRVQPSAGQKLNGTGDLRWFRFRLRDVWRFCGPADRLHVMVDGQPIPMNKRGTFYRPVNEGGSPLEELSELLANGWVFASNGVLNLDKTQDLAWQDQVLGLYQRVRAVLRDDTDHEPFMIYGSLLGAVREQGFIGHDFDFDAAYVSRHSDPAAVAAELGEVALTLIAAGFRVECHPTSLHVHDEIAGEERIDLFHLFFDDDGILRFPWGVAGSRPFRRQDWDGIAEIPFGRTTVSVPRNAEELVEVIYGGNWRTPNPGFSWERNRTEAATDARLPLEVIVPVDWEDFWSRHETRERSSFQELVSQRAQLPTTVVDLGCGDGCDAAAFAAAGGRTLGVERSGAALTRARRRSAAADGDRLTFESCDLADGPALETMLADHRAGEEPMVFFGRFLLHAVSEDVQESVLTAVQNVGRAGDVLALEFRGLEDEALEKRFLRPYRRFIDQPSVRRRIEAAGFELISAESGTGLAPYETEDPFVHRLIGVRT